MELDPAEPTPAADRGTRVAGSRRSAASGAVTPHPPAKVSFPSMLQRWSTIAFLHWRVEPAQMRSLVPPELEIDTFDGSAWVGLIPFRMHMRFPFDVPIPLLSSYPETNVRTYVLDPSGRRGLWFFSLDVSKAAAAVVARIGFGLPYAWSAMSLHEEGPTVSYSAERREPARGVRSSITVTAQAAPWREPDELAHFLTARFRLFARGPLGLYSISVEHRPWTLAPAVADEVDDGLLESHGIRVVEKPDHVCASRGVDVRVGWPAAVRRTMSPSSGGRS
jgi:uncharacterized protein